MVASTLRTLKMAVEVLGGLKQGEALGCPVIYVQGHDPRKDASNQLNRGDQWINENTDTMSYWSGDRWKKLQ